MTCRTEEGNWSAGTKCGFMKQKSKVAYIQLVTICAVLQERKFRKRTKTAWMNLEKNYMKKKKVHLSSTYLQGRGKWRTEIWRKLDNIRQTQKMNF